MKPFSELTSGPDQIVQMNKIVNLSDLRKINVKNFLKIIKKDKKNKRNEIRLVLTKGFGKMFIKSFNSDIKFTSLFSKYIYHIKNLEMNSQYKRSHG